jgi:hypothetical protein
MPNAPDLTRCPLCGETNACALAARQPDELGARECWCIQVTISRTALERVPAAARGRACICRSCAESVGGA